MIPAPVVFGPGIGLAWDGQIPRGFELLDFFLG
jgi:hypothetical protein